MNLGEYDKPPDIDNDSKDDDEEGVDTEPGNEPTEHHDKSGYVPPIGDTASEGHDEVGNVHKSDTEAENNSTKSGGPYEKPIERVDNAKAHDGDNATTMLHMKPNYSSIPMSQDHSTYHSDSACSYPNTSDKEATFPPTTRNVDRVYANMTNVNTTALLD
jgi:hypothetical protein